MTTPAGRAERDRIVWDFQHRMQELGHQDLRKMHAWYHTIDLGNGIVTPGVYDYRPLLDRFQFPRDMKGMRVLDVGSATGFFAFEFERRGAEVTSVELASMRDWDMPSGDDRLRTLQVLMERHRAETYEELDWLHLEGPFQFCHKLLGSRVRRIHSTVYDLTAEKLGREAFDVVFLGDVLLHVFSPLMALSRIAALTGGLLVISQTIPDVAAEQPLMLYLGGADRQGDNRTWWYPNRVCFNQMLTRLGFVTVDFVNQFEVLNELEGVSNRNTVLHARK